MPSFTRNSLALICFSSYEKRDQPAAGFERANNTTRGGESSIKRRLSVGELSGIIPRMKTKNWLPQLTILVGLLALIGGGYALARLLPDASTAPGLMLSQPGQPVFATFHYAYSAMTPIPYSSEEPGAATTQGRIRSFDLSPDMKTIALATSHGIVLWDLDHKNVRVLNETENFFSVAWSPDGKKLAAGGLIMWDSEIGKPHLVVWDISSWKVVFEPEYGDDMLDTLYGDVAWSPDGRFLATSNGYMGVTTFDTRSGEVISKQDIFSGAISDISWSPDGSRLVATGDMAYAIRRWRVDTDDWVRLFNPRASFSLAVQWSPDGKRIASGHTGGAVCFWTAETNECDGFIQAHQNATFSLVWSPDGTRLATGGGIIRIWNTQTGLLDTSFGLSDTSVYSKLAWPKPDLLISLEAGYEEEMPTIVRFWDLSTGKILMEFQGANGLLLQ
jgi:WD40 repeat protein